VNGRGQTFAAIPGPVEFTMGSPESEPGRQEGRYEDQHRRHIGRHFAIGLREVSVADVKRWEQDFKYRKKYSPVAGGPMIDVSWYAAAQYCNWLSEQEKIPEDQWCYIPDPKSGFDTGMRMAPDYLTRTGYRLPSEAEWEYAARAGALTARYYGRGEAILGRYACFAKNSKDHTSECGSLKPNDLGLFDVLGNALEWCCDEYTFYQTDGGRVTDDKEHSIVLASNQQRMMRGGSFNYQPAYVRSAARHRDRPILAIGYVGFRLARTLPPDFFSAAPDRR
jgi:formylglycine-generating enzyme required for sulfatase activity